MEKASREPWIEYEHNPRAMQLIEYTLKEFWDIFVDDRLCGRGPWASSGCMGQCASTHILNAMECPREIRSVWRVLLLPCEERADGPQGVGSVWTQHPSRSSESMCFGRLAHDGRGEFLAVGQ